MEENFDQTVNSFVVYRSFVDSIRKFHELGVITGDNVASLFYAMSGLALDGAEPDLSPIEDAVFTQIRPQIEANRKKAQDGSFGGRPAASVSASEINAKYEELGSWDAVADFFGLSRQSVYRIRSRDVTHGVTPDVTRVTCDVTQNVTVTKPNANANENANENEEEKEGAQSAAPALQATPAPSPSSNAAPKQKRFIPPTVEEVAAYCKERDNGIDAESFVAFYESKGWFVGKNKMKDWRQAVITWEKRDKERKAAEARASPQPVYQHWEAPERPEISDEEREQALAVLRGTVKGLAKRKTAQLGGVR